MYDKLALRQRWLSWLFLLIFTALPLVGLVSGPAYAPILFGLAVLARLPEPTTLRFDRPLWILLILFSLLGLLGWFTSVAPPLTAQKLPQTIAILVASLVLLTAPAPDEDLRRRLFPSMLAAMAVAVAILCADRVMGYPLQNLLTHHAANAPWKYNRGLMAAVLLAWPMMQNLEQSGRRTHAIALALLLGLALLVGLSSTGLLAFAVSLVIFALARLAPKLTLWLLGMVSSVAILALPWLMQALSAQRPKLAPLIKSSGLHRLEIWDYMSARILEHPLIGWGLGAAKAVPIRPEEMAGYLYVSPDGVYPHNQWIEAWLELGLPGVLLGLALVWLALRRCRSAYAIAAVAAALVMSGLNFEITTDSWWAALAASALLFRADIQSLATRKI